MGEEEARLLPHLGQQLVEIVGRRRTFAGLDALRRRGAREQAVFGVVDQLAFLALLHPLDQQAELFLNLVERLAVEVGDARLHVEDGGDRLEEILARVRIVVDEGLRQIRIAVARRAALDVSCGDLLLLDPIEAEDARFDRRPGEEVDQPARRDAAPLRARLGRIGELARRPFAQRPSGFNLVSHTYLPLCNSIFRLFLRTPRPLMRIAMTAQFKFRLRR